MKKLLFVTLGSFSNINRSIENQLTNHFSDHKIDKFDLEPLVKKNVLVLGLGVLALLKEYFFDFLLGEKKIFRIKRYYYNTTFIIRFFNSKIETFLLDKDYDFIFQTQSLFNSGNKGIPNFIYTDNTALNNLSFNLIKKNEFRFSNKYIVMEKQIYETATLIFVMSGNIRESLIRQYGVKDEKIKLVFAGGNTEIGEVVNKEKYASKNILFVGKHWGRKGGPLLVEAFKIVQQALPDASLTIIGCSPKISLRNCKVLGKVSLSTIAYHYNNASLFCLPTKREPFGIVFIEAMLNRLPIVTNSVGATPELVIDNENGFKVEYDPRKYAEKLLYLLNNPALCEQFGKHSYEIAKNKYTWNNVGNLIAGYIKETIVNVQNK